MLLNASGERRVAARDAFMHMRWGFWPATALIACGLSIPAAARASERCSSDLTGRELVLPATTRAFAGPEQPPLPLAHDEYVITIDDGPNPATTPRLLDILKSECVTATFFLIGRNAAAHPDLLKQIESEGSNFGSHSWSHPDFGKLNLSQIESEITRGVETVQTAADTVLGRGKPIRLFRFPGGPTFPRVPPADALALAGKHDLVVAGVDFSPQDWRNSPPVESFARLMNGFGDRGVLLFHDGQPNTILLLPMVLDELRRRHATIVSLKLTPVR